MVHRQRTMREWRWNLHGMCSNIVVLWKCYFQEAVLACVLLTASSVGQPSRRWRNYSNFLIFLMLFAKQYLSSSEKFDISWCIQHPCELHNVSHTKTLQTVFERFECFDILCAQSVSNERINLGSNCGIQTLNFQRIARPLVEPTIWLKKSSRVVSVDTVDPHKKQQGYSSSYTSSLKKI